MPFDGSPTTVSLAPYAVAYEAIEDANLMIKNFCEGLQSTFSTDKAYVRYSHADLTMTVAPGINDLQ